MKTYTWVLPINVDTVDTFILDKLCEILCKGITIIDNCSSDDIVGCCLRGISPTTKGDNPLEIEFFESLPLTTFVGYDRLPCVGIDPIPELARKALK